MLLTKATRMSGVWTATYGHMYAIFLVYAGCATARTTLIWEACAATRGNDDIWAQTAQGACLDP